MAATETLDRILIKAKRPIRQPSMTTCGQTVIAMIAGCAIARVTELAGSQPMDIEEMRDTLALFGIRMGQYHAYEYPERRNRPALFLKTWIEGHKVMHHWLLWTGETFWNPDCGAAEEPRLPSDTAGRFWTYEPTAALSDETEG